MLPQSYVAPSCLKCANHRVLSCDTPLRRKVIAWMPPLSRRLLLGASAELPSGSKMVGGSDSLVIFGLSSKVNPIPGPVPTIPSKRSSGSDSRSWLFQKVSCCMVNPSKSRPGSVRRLVPLKSKMVALSPAKSPACSSRAALVRIRSRPL